MARINFVTYDDHPADESIVIAAKAKATKAPAPAKKPARAPAKKAVKKPVKKPGRAKKAHEAAEKAKAPLDVHAKRLKRLFGGASKPFFSALGQLHDDKSHSRRDVHKMLKEHFGITKIGHLDREHSLNVLAENHCEALHNKTKKTKKTRKAAKTAKTALAKAAKKAKPVAKNAKKATNKKPAKKVAEHQHIEHHVKALKSAKSIEDFDKALEAASKHKGLTKEDASVITHRYIGYEEGRDKWPSKKAALTAARDWFKHVSYEKVRDERRGLASYVGEPVKAKAKA